MRDEFSFRCVYCLKRENWGTITGDFDIDHFDPQTTSPTLSLDYENLLYSCHSCNLTKQANLIPGPLRALTDNKVRIYPDGSITGLTKDSEYIISRLALNRSTMKDWRLRWIRISAIAKDHSDQSLYKQIMGYPSNLPDLASRRAPRNDHPEAVENCFYAQRKAGTLPETYLT